MKNRVIYISAIILFLIVNTSYYWEGKLGILAFPGFALLAIIFLFITLILILQIYLTFKEKFRFKHRIITISIALPLLILIIYKPGGLINYDKLEGRDLLIASAEGGGNCSTTIKFKENNRFIDQAVCFGVTKTMGCFKLRNDTILLYDSKMKKNEDYSFAIIKKEDNELNNKLGTLIIYHAFNDSLPEKLAITYNELIN